MSTGRVLLVHGFSGAPSDLGPLAEALRKDPGAPDVEVVDLDAVIRTGGGRFDGLRLARVVADAARGGGDSRKVAIMGHSTGGLLALEAARLLREERCGPRVALVALLCTPLEIDGHYMRRWGEHPCAGPKPTFADLGRIAALARSVTAGIGLAPEPTMAIFAQLDALVPAAAGVALWSRVASPSGAAIVPGADHRLMEGRGSRVAIDLLGRVVEAALGEEEEELDRRAGVLSSMEPGLEGYLRLASPWGREVLSSPSAARASGVARGLPAGLGVRCASAPSILNVEVTTACNAMCGHCARTFLGRTGVREMSPADFDMLLGLLPGAWRVTIVGLGEPTSHSSIAELVSLAARRGRRVSIVTNGAGMDREMSRDLIAVGLGGVVFSIDTVDHRIAGEIRPGIDVDLVLENLSAFVEEAKDFKGDGDRGSPGAAVFCALGTANARGLSGVARAVAEAGADALVVTDLNFPRNEAISLRRGSSRDDRTAIEEGIREALRLRLPILPVGALEELAIPSRFRELLMTSPSRLWSRPIEHSSCLSPWQTIPVGVDGTVTACDCRPSEEAGNIFEEPLGEIWNGEVMRRLRERMIASRDDLCATCPRY